MKKILDLFLDDFKKRAIPKSQKEQKDQKENRPRNFIMGMTNQEQME
ncbi:hypothetical protein [Maribacter sp. 2307ULW6-5]